jgi:predicted DNA-binding transcriptional regulator AlpA
VHRIPPNDSIARRSGLVQAGFPVLYRFKDLVAAGLVANRTSLTRLVDNDNFPPGVMIGRNTRVWRAADIEAWLATRPTARKVTPPNARHPRVLNKRREAQPTWEKANPATPCRVAIRLFVQLRERGAIEHEPVSYQKTRKYKSAKNDFAHAINVVASCGTPERMVEAAITERRKAIVTLQKALEKEPRGFQWARAMRNGESNGQRRRH